MRKLQDDRPLFVGFKLDKAMRWQIKGMTGPDKKYISADSSEFLRMCLLGDDVWLGKLVEERLSTDRIDDVRRNVLSFMQRLFPDTRVPQHLEIIVCGDEEGEPPPLRSSDDDV